MYYTDFTMSNLNQPTDSFNFYTTGDTWRVVKTEQGHANCRFNNERMRITHEGDVMFGETLYTLDRALETYEFMTYQSAYSHKRLCENLDKILYDFRVNTGIIPSITYTGTGIGTVNPSTLYINNPPLGNWTCYLFGNKPNTSGITWRPVKGQEPNWFWRKMQWLILGNLWIKDK